MIIRQKSDNVAVATATLSHTSNLFDFNYGKYTLILDNVYANGLHALRRFTLRNLTDFQLSITLGSDLGTQIAFQLSNENLPFDTNESLNLSPNSNNFNDPIRTSFDAAKFNQLFNYIGHVRNIVLEPRQVSSVILAFLPPTDPWNQNGLENDGNSSEYTEGHTESFFCIDGMLVFTATVNPNSIPPTTRSSMSATSINNTNNNNIPVNDEGVKNNASSNSSMTPWEDNSQLSKNIASNQNNPMYSANYGNMEYNNFSNRTSPSNSNYSPSDCSECNSNCSAESVESQIIPDTYDPFKNMPENSKDDPHILSNRIRNSEKPNSHLSKSHSAKHENRTKNKNNRKNTNEHYGRKIEDSESKPESWNQADTNISNDNKFKGLSPVRDIPSFVASTTTKLGTILRPNIGAEYDDHPGKDLLNSMSYLQLSEGLLIDKETGLSTTPPRQRNLSDNLLSEHNSLNGDRDETYNNTFPAQRCNVEFHARVCKSLMDVTAKVIQTVEESNDIYSKETFLPIEEIFIDNCEQNISYVSEFWITNQSEISLFWICDYSDQLLTLELFHDNEFIPIKPHSQNPPINLYSSALVRCTVLPCLADYSSIRRLNIQVENVYSSTNVIDIPVILEYKSNFPNSISQYSCGGLNETKVIPQNKSSESDANMSNQQQYDKSLSNETLDKIVGTEKILDNRISKSKMENSSNFQNPCGLTKSVLQEKIVSQSNTRRNSFNSACSDDSGIIRTGLLREPKQSMPIPMNKDANGGSLSEFYGVSPGTNITETSGSLPENERDKTVRNIHDDELDGDMDFDIEHRNGDIPENQNTKVRTENDIKVKSKGSEQTHRETPSLNDEIRRGNNYRTISDEYEDDDEDYDDDDFDDEENENSGRARENFSRNSTSALNKSFSAFSDESLNRDTNLQVRQSNENRDQNSLTVPVRYHSSEEASENNVEKDGNLSDAGVDVTGLDTYFRQTKDRRRGNRNFNNKEMSSRSSLRVDKSSETIHDGSDMKSAEEELDEEMVAQNKLLNSVQAALGQMNDDTSSKINSDTLGKKDELFSNGELSNRTPDRLESNYDSDSDFVSFSQADSINLVSPTDTTDEKVVEEKVVDNNMDISDIVSQLNDQSSADVHQYDGEELNLHGLLFNSVLNQPFLDFGASPINSPRIRTLNIYNPTTKPLVIDIVDNIVYNESPESDIAIYVPNPDISLGIYSSKGSVDRKEAILEAMQSSDWRLSKTSTDENLRKIKGTGQLSPIPSGISPRQQIADFLPDPLVSPVSQSNNRQHLQLQSTNSSAKNTINISDTSDNLRKLDRKQNDYDLASKYLDLAVDSYSPRKRIGSINPSIFHNNISPAIRRLQTTQTRYLSAGTSGPSLQRKLQDAFNSAGNTIDSNAVSIQKPPRVGSKSAAANPKSTGLILASTNDNVLMESPTQLNFLPSLTETFDEIGRKVYDNDAISNPESHLTDSLAYSSDLANEYLYDSVIFNDDGALDTALAPLNQFISLQEGITVGNFEFPSPLTMSTKIVLSSLYKELNVRIAGRFRNPENTMPELSEEQQYTRSRILLLSALNQSVDNKVLIRPRRIIVPPEKYSCRLIVVARFNEKMRLNCVSDPLKLNKVESNLTLRIVNPHNELLTKIAKHVRRTKVTPDSNSSTGVISDIAEDDDSSLISADSSLGVSTTLPNDLVTNKDLDLKILLSASVCKIGMELNQKNINFGHLTRDETKTKTILLRNQSELSLLYNIRKSGSIASGDIHIAPQNELGLIKPFGKKEVLFTFKPTLSGPFQEHISVENILDRSTEQITFKSVIKRQENFILDDIDMNFGPSFLDSVNTIVHRIVISSTSFNKSRTFEVRVNPEEFQFTHCNGSFAFELLDRNDDYVLDESSYTTETGDGLEKTAYVRRWRHRPKMILSKEIEEQIEHIEQKVKIARRKGRPDKVEKLLSKLEQLRSGILDSTYANDDDEKNIKRDSVRHVVVVGGVNKPITASSAGTKEGDQVASNSMDATSSDQQNDQNSRKQSVVENGIRKENKSNEMSVNTKSITLTSNGELFRGQTAKDSSEFGSGQEFTMNSQIVDEPLMESVVTSVSSSINDLSNTNNFFTPTVRTRNGFKQQPNTGNFKGLGNVTSVVSSMPTSAGSIVASPVSASATTPVTTGLSDKRAAIKVKRTSNSIIFTLPPRTIQTVAVYFKPFRKSFQTSKSDKFIWSFPNSSVVSDESFEFDANKEQNVGHVSSDTSLDKTTNFTNDNSLASMIGLYKPDSKPTQIDQNSAKGSMNSLKLIRPVSSSSGSFDLAKLFIPKLKSRVSIENDESRNQVFGGINCPCHKDEYLNSAQETPASNFNSSINDIISNFPLKTIQQASKMKIVESFEYIETIARIIRDSKEIDDVGPASGVESNDEDTVGFGRFNLFNESNMKYLNEAFELVCDTIEFSSRLDTLREKCKGSIYVNEYKNTDSVRAIGWQSEVCSDRADYIKALFDARNDNHKGITSIKPSKWIEKPSFLTVPLNEIQINSLISTSRGADILSSILLSESEINHFVEDYKSPFIGDILSTATETGNSDNQNNSTNIPAPTIDFNLEESFKKIGGRMVAIVSANNSAKLPSVFSPGLLPCGCVLYLLTLREYCILAGISIFGNVISSKIEQNANQQENSYELDKTQPIDESLNGQSVDGYSDTTILTNNVANFNTLDQKFVGRPSINSSVIDCGNGEFNESNENLVENVESRKSTSLDANRTIDDTDLSENAEAPPYPVELLNYVLN